MALQPKAGMLFTLSCKRKGQTKGEIPIPNDKETGQCGNTFSSIDLLVHP